MIQLLQSSSGEKYRVFFLGARRIDSGMARGVIIPSGARIEVYDEVCGLWIYKAQIHPDDVSSYTRGMTPINDVA